MYLDCRERIYQDVGRIGPIRPPANPYAVPVNLRKEAIAKHSMARWICCQANMSSICRAVCRRVRRMDILSLSSGVGE